MFKILFYRTLFSQSAASLTAGYLASYIRENNYNVQLALLEKNRMDNLTKIISENEKYPVIIYKCNFQDYNEGTKLLSALKEVCPNSKIYIMGYFAEINAKQLIKKYEFVDGIVYGDGCDFAIAYGKSEGKKLIGGLFRMSDGSLYENCRHTYIPLDKLPNPARDIEKTEQCKYINLIWRNGCFGTCSFCHINLVKRPFSARSIESVVEEIEDCYVNMGKKMFIFNDNVFWCNKRDDKSIERFVELIEQKGLDISFMIYLRCQPFIGEERLKLLKRAGLRRVFIGIENISDSFSEKYNKKIDEYDKILATFDKLKISYHIGFIIFHPSATVQEVIENIDYLYKLNKLYRLGIIVEKMRLLSVERIKGNDERDRVDVAYDYQFENSSVEKIYNVLCRFFDLFDVRDYENVCTSTLYLINLYGNKYDEWNAPCMNHFNDLIQEYNDFACLLFKDITEIYDNYNEDELFEYAKEKYFDTFENYYYRLQAGRGLVYDYVSKKNSDLQLMVSHGQKRLNAYD